MPKDEMTREEALAGLGEAARVLALYNPELATHAREALTVLSAPVPVCAECGGTGEITKGLQGFKLPCKCVSAPAGEVAIGAQEPAHVTFGHLVPVPDPTTGERIYREATDEEKRLSALYYAELTRAEVQAMAAVVITAESSDAAWDAASKVYIGMRATPPARSHDGCKCASCKSLDKMPAAEFVSLLGEQVDSEATESLRTRDAAITAAAERRGYELGAKAMADAVLAHYRATDISWEYIERDLAELRSKLTQNRTQ